MCDTTVDAACHAATRVVVFARLPVPGRVKTRLAADVGPGEACTLYSACAQHTIAVALDCPGVDVELAHSFVDTTDDVRQWATSFLKPEQLARLKIEPQVADPDLGVKMLAALHKCLDTPGVDRAIVIGTDIPDMSVHVLEACSNMLQSHDIVMGPAEDGGYYLLGLSARVCSATKQAGAAGLFRGVQWSTSHVLQATSAAAADLGLSIAPPGQLPRLRDIDTLRDMADWVHSTNMNTITDTNIASEFVKRRAELHALAGAICERHTANSL